MSAKINLDLSSVKETENTEMIVKTQIKCTESSISSGSSLFTKTKNIFKERYVIDF